MKTAIIALFLFLCIQASADELYVRNKPFRGVISGTGSELYASGKDLAEAVGGTWETTPGEGFLLKMGSLLVTGTEVEHKTDPDGVTLVNIRQTAKALGGKTVINKELGTVDFYLESNGSATASSGNSDDWNTGWRKDITGSLFPEGSVRGRVGGHRFELLQTEAVLRNLIFKSVERRQSVKLIFLKEKKLGGQDLKISPDERHSGTHVRMEWVDDSGETQNESFMSGYSLKLQLDHPIEGEAKGRIYLTLPDEDKSMLKGEFSVKI